MRVFTWLALAFLYLPLVVVVILSFNSATSLSWPPRGFTLDWWSKAWEADGPREAFVTSIKVALAATVIALVLGTLAAFALQRYHFFGKTSISFLLILPIALPGIVTAVALQNYVQPAHRSRRLRLPGGLRVPLASSSPTPRSVWWSPTTTSSRGSAGCHRTCWRPRPTSAPAVSRRSGYVTFPLIRSALLAGGILAFALSFDEIVVTTFTSGPGVETLPQWILNNFTRPNNVPLVTVVATVVMLLSIPLAWLAQRLSDGTRHGVHVRRPSSSLGQAEL